MNKNNVTTTQKLTLSAMVIALYVVILYVTQGFSFGAYQIRIATSMYALGYLFPFLIIPLGLANFIANMLFGGLGLLDMIGGCMVGIITTATVVGIKHFHLNRCFIAVAITFLPGLLVPIWLSYLLNIPYQALAISLCIGQLIPGICGVALIRVLETVLYPKKGKVV